MTRRLHNDAVHANRLTAIEDRICALMSNLDTFVFVKTSGWKNFTKSEEEKEEEEEIVDGMMNESVDFF